VHVDPLFVCSSVEQVFVTVGTVRSVTVCVDSVCEIHVVYMRARMQV
jgi:ribosomal protein L31